MALLAGFSTVKRNPFSPGTIFRADFFLNKGHALEGTHRNAGFGQMYCSRDLSIEASRYACAISRCREDQLGNSYASEGVCLVLRVYDTV